MVKIIQFQAMPNTQTWQGHILALGDDGRLYIDEYDQDAGGVKWKVYAEAPTGGEQ